MNQLNVLNGLKVKKCIKNNKNQKKSKKKNRKKEAGAIYEKSAISKWFGLGIKPKDQSTLVQEGCGAVE